MNHKDENERDDENWSEILIGNKVSNVNEDTRKEAEELRTLLLNKLASDPDELKLRRGEKELLTRLKNEGLIKPKKNIFTKLSLMTIAASVSILAITLNIVINIQNIPNVSDGFNDLPTYRTKNNIFNLIVNKPEKLMDEFKSALYESSMPYRVSDLENGWRIEFYPVKTKSSKVYFLIEKYNLSTDQHGWVKVNLLHKK